MVPDPCVGRSRPLNGQLERFSRGIDGKAWKRSFGEYFRSNNLLDQRDLKRDRLNPIAQHFKPTVAQRVNIELPVQWPFCKWSGARPNSTQSLRTTDPEGFEDNLR